MSMIEDTLIANCLYYGNGTYREWAEEVKPEYFTERKHQIIWAVLTDLFKEGAEIGPTVVAAELDRRGQLAQVGGLPALLGGYIDAVGIDSRTRYYAQEVIEQARRRQVAAEVQSLLAETQDGQPIAEVVEKHLPKIGELAARSDRSVVYSPEMNAELATKHYQTAVQLRDSGRICAGLETGFPALDRLLNGLGRSDYTILGARPGIGKTTLALQIALHVAKKEKQRVGIFSLEMSAEQIAARLACILGRVHADRYRTGTLTYGEEELLCKSVAELAVLPITTLETPALTVSQVRVHIDRLSVGGHAYGLWIIDHLHLMAGPGETPYQRLSEISRQLRAMALEVGVHLLVLAQLSRRSAEREDRAPQMSDLRDSGSIEQDAVNVLLLHRPGYYRELVKQAGAQADSLLRDSMVIVPKNRFGPTGEVELVWLSELALFGNPSGQKEMIG